MKIIIIIVCLLTILTACSPSQQSERGSGTPDGLHISFLEFQPRSELMENEYFDIGLKLENKAECEVKGELCISDSLAESISGIQDDCKQFELRKKEDNIIDSKNIYFQDNGYVSVSGDLISEITAKAEYSCSIQLTPQICIKPSIEDETICKTKETLTSSTLGLKQAPITVSKIDKTIIQTREGTKLSIAINLRKMSKGEPNKFNINVEYEGYGPLTCRNIERLNFKTNTENIINCEISLNVEDIENNPLKIRLDYFYETSESKQIKIIKEKGDIQ